jgi:hypothetical protein
MLAVPPLATLFAKGAKKIEDVGSSTPRFETEALIAVAWDNCGENILVGDEAGTVHLLNCQVLDQALVKTHTIHTDVPDSKPSIQCSPNPPADSNGAEPAVQALTWLPSSSSRVTQRMLTVHGGMLSMYKWNPRQGRMAAARARSA